MQKGYVLLMMIGAAAPAAGQGVTWSPPAPVTAAVPASAAVAAGVASAATAVPAALAVARAALAEANAALAGAVVAGEAGVAGLAAVGQQDPADAIFNEANEAMTRGNYRRAAELFHRVGERYPRSRHVGQALYFEAFSLYRDGGTDDLRQALTLLKRLGERHAAIYRRDGSSLETRICGELARYGDRRCAAELVEKANQSTSRSSERTDRGGRAGATGGDCPRAGDQNDDRLMALNALLHMNAENAMPILERVMERRDGCTAVLRRQAVFLISQKKTPRTVDLLFDAARNDPDRETREAAIFWLGSTGDERATTMLEGILNSSADDAMKDKALFALTQHRGARGQQILRDYAVREGGSKKIREQAIFWLGQRRSQENADFLRSIYGRLRDNALKEKVLFSASQMRGYANDRWLLEVALDEREDMELRKQALFWAGQMGGTTRESIEQIGALYDRVRAGELKNQIIFVLSQRRDARAVDKLMDIARNEKDRELRKQAVFWLGQSRDPRVQQFLLELINR